MHNGAPEWNFKCNSSDKYCNRKMCAIFQVILSRSNLSASTKNKDGNPSTLNPRREFQGQTIICKTILHCKCPEPSIVG